MVLLVDTDTSRYIHNITCMNPIKYGGGVYVPMKRHNYFYVRREIGSLKIH